MSSLSAELSRERKRTETTGHRCTDVTEIRWWSATATATYVISAILKMMRGQPVKCVPQCWRDVVVPSDTSDRGVGKGKGDRGTCPPEIPKLKIFGGFWLTHYCNCYWHICLQLLGAGHQTPIGVLPLDPAEGLPFIRPVASFVPLRNKFLATPLTSD